MCGIWAWDTNSFDQVIKIIANGMIPVEKLVTRTIKLDDIVKEGFDVLAFDKENKEMKIQVVIRDL
jgi:(R,R)-butanediol dehydrogenase/meso-butanediol dehydrogenase/diacetyl reductase